ncbi:MAG: gliding motility-associated C-terminal domain-containing protein [Prevotellaceae bacterium]|jgi:gliding motility-associated-like protein|nr:gliding motility-associated C-terminal domain-containing protein [Prevotellaceae bacterium]
MKKYFSLIFLLIPLAAAAQLSAVKPDAVKPTQWLTGRPEQVFVFFDKTAATLSAQDISGAASTFTWWLLNPADTSFTEQKNEPDVTVSSLAVTKTGGYQVQVKNALRDTAFSCWVFFDDFKIDTISSFNECNGLRLEMATTPKMRNGYTIYNFKAFLTPPAHTGDSTFTGWQTIRWDSGEDIHEDVEDADESWKQRSNSYYTVIAAPPPLKASDYSVTVTDVFGKSASYTTLYTTPAIAAYAKITAEAWTENQWNATTENPLNGEALYRVRFSAEKSKNVDKHYWKGFGDANKNVGRQIMWSDSITIAPNWVIPHSPYKNDWVDGYVPGSYTVRLTVRNTASGCADSTEVGLVIAPSKFSSDAIPNAFTPNGDGYNDVFRFVKDNEPESMEHIQVYIFSRSGALAYRYEGRMDEWQGWNGKRMGTGNDVADGVYYYVISGEGWDGVQYNTSEYKGSLHVFR